MPSLNSYETGFCQLLSQALDKLQANKTADLVHGDFLNAEDSATTAQNYAGAVSYLRALSDVRVMCHDIEQDLLKA